MEFKGSRTEVERASVTSSPGNLTHISGQLGRWISLAWVNDATRMTYRRRSIVLSESELLD